MKYTQLELAEAMYEPPSVPVNTSEAAAEHIKPTAHTLRALVLQFIKSCGTHGATDQEIAKALNMTENTARPRRYELAGLGKYPIMKPAINKKGKRRTLSGCHANVWVAVEYLEGDVTHP